MKQTFLLVLTCGLYAGSFAQNESSKREIINADKWVVTPVKGVTKGMGRLNLIFPAGVEWSIDIYTAQNKFIINRSLAGKHTSYELAPGYYNFKLNTVIVENVPIEEGKETRLRSGVLEITSSLWELRNESTKKFLTSGNKSKKMVLPIGKYLLMEGKNNRLKEIVDEHEVIITGKSNSEEKTATATSDNEIGIENPEDLIMSNHSQWVITDLPGVKPTPGKISKGLLDLDFEGGTNWSMQIKNTETGVSHQANGNRYAVTRNKTLSLDHGEYEIKLNNVIIKNVPIRSDKKTRVKAGLVTVNYITPGGSSLPVKVYVYDMNKSYNEYYFLANGPMQKIMPVGTYGLRVWGDWPANSIEINDKETRQLIITTKIFTLQANGVSWFLCNTDETVIPCYFFGGNGTRTLYLPLGNYKLKYGSTSVAVTVSSTGQNSITIPQ